MVVSRQLESAAAAAEPFSGGTQLPPGPPWSLRLARGTAGRPALEVYENGTLLDVMVATPVAAEVLRGARRARTGGDYRVLAWGRLLPDGATVTVTFRRGRFRTASSAAAVTAIGTWFWVAVAGGYFNRVCVGYGRAGCGP